MRKNIFTYMLILLVCILPYNNVHALTELQIDRLIENEQKQKEISKKINELDLELKKEESESIEVISISFLEEDMDLVEEKEYSLQENKKALEKELENIMIDSIQIQKSIEKEKKEYLDKNNLSFIPGIWPLKSYYEISSAYGQRIHPITKKANFHRGIDIPAPKSTEILASDDGIVEFSGSQNGYGNVVKVKHFDGKTTVYAHNSYNRVNKGDIVKKGQAIAEVGSTGNSTGNHVHFEILLNGETTNPIDGVIK